MDETTQIDAADGARLARQMAPAIQFLSERYTGGLTPAPQLPPDLRRAFRRDMEDFDRTMAQALSDRVVSAFEKADDMDGAVGEIGAEFQAQMGRLSNLLRQSDQSFRSYLALAEQREFPYCVFLSEQSPVTCRRCLGRHGELLTLADVVEQEALPPLHPHCRCRLVAMDDRMAWLFRRNRAGMVEQLREALNGGFGRAGGLFRLSHDAWQAGFSPETIQRLELPRMAAVTEGIHTQPEWYEGLKEWALQFGSDALDALDALNQRGQMLFVRADETMEKNPLLGLLLWADALAFGIPSALWEGVVHRWQMVTEGPSLYTVLNFLTMGLGELINGALMPEEPWSFQHFMDMIGLTTLIYGSVRGIQGALRREAGLGAADDVLGMTDDALDDAARAAAEQVDDGLDDSLRAVAGGADDTLDDVARAALSSLDDVLDDAARSVGEVVAVSPADEVNRLFLKAHPDLDPPYLSGTQVYQVRLIQQTGFVRVYGGDSGQVGRWMMRVEDVAGLTPKQIENKFSLPGTPTHICQVTLPADTVVEVSGASAIMGGTGHGVQYRIIGDCKADWFLQEQILN